jgi:hypothetical protein
MLKNNKETWGMDFSQRKFYKEKKKESEVWAHRGELAYNENELKSINLVYIVLKWTSYLIS